ncbi:PREDICTED: uncharacterized protein LOC109128463 [Camelina sativa]|uniref:Uncharacterized protein LOC109128463 n=1 Tax=Camelina sativa TaxID=90675 RepID=A0ABM1QUC9_CAMSA|nr:PREDICTED: uncharacterized protein LOC109128463 [Camelina sativa]
MANNNMTDVDDVVVGDNSIEIESERTIFLTFARGVPVSEAEVKQFFTVTYGENCVKGVDMQYSDGQQQSLFARLFLDSVATMNRILDGKREQSKKFLINEKLIWARKHEI